MGIKKLTCMDCKFSEYQLPIYCYCKLKEIDVTRGEYLKASKCNLYQGRFTTWIKSIFGYYK
jgi:hypothetical protein